jgi:hypothetical protein
MQWGEKDDHTLYVNFPDSRQGLQVQRTDSDHLMHSIYFHSVDNDTTGSSPNGYHAA